MDFRIADTFTDSLARLTGDEQKVAKTTAFDLQVNPASPGLSFHKLDKARDRNFWSVRVGSDIRLIVHLYLLRDSATWASVPILAAQLGVADQRPFPHVAIVFPTASRHPRRPAEGESAARRGFGTAIPLASRPSMNVERQTTSSTRSSTREPPRTVLIQTGLFRALARLVFTLTGWKAMGTPPRGTPRYVMICAPHTSYWDGFWMLGCASLLGIDLRFLGKHTMFKGPLGWLMKGLGAVPVIRSQRQNTVQQAAAWFRASDAFLLGVAPEGTRGLTQGWKTGFYWIAMEANVPIACAFIDYRTKTGGFLEAVIHPTGNIDADFALFEKAYSKITPKFKEKQGPIQPLAQPPATSPKV